MVHLTIAKPTCPECYAPKHPERGYQIHYVTCRKYSEFAYDKRLWEERQRGQRFLFNLER